MSSFEKMALGNQLNVTLKKSIKWHSGLLRHCHNHRAIQKTHGCTYNIQTANANSSLYIWGGGKKKEKKEREREGNTSSFLWKNNLITIKTRVNMDNFFTYTWAHTSTALF